MKRDTITLEFDEEFYAALKKHVAFIGYDSIEDYAWELIVAHVSDTIEELNRDCKSKK